MTCCKIRSTYNFIMKKKREHNLQRSPRHTILEGLTPKGTINGIWLTQKAGSLHQAIIPNVSASGSRCQGCWFSSGFMD